MNGKQGGIRRSLPMLSCNSLGSRPPARFAAVADAVQTFDTKADTLRAQADAHRSLTSSLSYAA